jgi:ketosteroid isomerase-like protein
MSDAKRVLEQAIELWNAGDREGWAALYDENVEWAAPGGARISGLADLKVRYYDALLEAAPDRASLVDSLFAEGDLVAEEGRYTGTHTGTWRSPDGVEIPATGKSVDFPFSAIFRVKNGKIASIRLYYDQLEVLTQLGLVPAPAQNPTS